MVKIVVLINTLISVILLYLAWRVWQWRLLWTKITNWFTLAEVCTHAVLYKAPEAIFLSQHEIYNWRQKNQILELQLQQLQKAIGLLKLGWRIWRRYLRGLKVKI